MPIWIDVGDGTVIPAPLVSPPPAVPPPPPPPVVEAPPPPPPVVVSEPPPNVGAILTGIVNPTQTAPPPPEIVNPPAVTPVPAGGPPPELPPSTQGQPIPQPGHPLVEIDTGDVIPAPVATDYVPPPPPPLLVGDGSDEPSARGPSLEDYGDPIQDSEEFFAANPPLEGQVFIQAMRDAAAAHDLDELAVAVNGQYEGFSGAIGDGGEAYGPWQDWMTHFKGRPWYGAGKNNQRVNFWAWSEAGIEYAMRSMVAAGAGGMRGPDACYRITYYYERPTNRAAQAVIRRDAYVQLAKQAAGVWDFFSGQAKGPVGWSGAQTTPAKPLPDKFGPDAAWKDLLHVIRVEVPATVARVKESAKDLVDVIP